MNIYTCVDHDGHYVGVASIVVAIDAGQARELLDTELQQHGLKPFAAHPYTLQAINPSSAAAVVLQDGDY